MGSVLNIWGIDFKYLKSIQQTDEEAIASDWTTVGDNMREALKQFNNENTE